MIVLRDISPVPADCLGSVMALGNFDGLHLGHRAIIAKAAALAEVTGKPLSLMTFEPHPRRVFRPDLPILRILPFRTKAGLLAEMKLDFLRVVHFTRAFSETSAEQFVRDILCGQLQVSHVVTGEDFTFGHKRAGNASYMQQMADKLGFGYTAHEAVIADGERCSTTRVRTLLGEGDVKQAARLLGRPYSVEGRVREGDKRGRQLGFPTANIVPARIFTPMSGVYAVRAKLNGREIAGVANLGHRPTFGGNRVQLETHFFDWSGDIYEERIEVQFIERIRAEKKFDGIDALKAQIAKDCEQARFILTNP